MVKSLPASAGPTGDIGLILGSGGSPGEGNGKPLQYSCLENPKHRGACGLQSVGSHTVRHTRTLLPILSLTSETRDSDLIWKIRAGSSVDSPQPIILGLL